jgi:hypothetical protein
MSSFAKPTKPGLVFELCLLVLLKIPVGIVGVKELSSREVVSFI